MPWSAIHLLISPMRIGTQLSHACWHAAMCAGTQFSISFCLAECDSESLVNYFLGHLRDSVPSARRDWLPPDPLQAEHVDVVMDLSV